jgi:hypothetical protein
MVQLSPLRTISQYQLHNRNLATQYASGSFWTTVNLYGFKSRDSVRACAVGFVTPFSGDNHFQESRVLVS